MISLLNPAGGSLTTSTDSDFDPIPIKDVLAQFLINDGDIATVLVQSALADTNHNNIFDTAEEYTDFYERMEDATDDYHDIDYSYLS